MTILPRNQTPVQARMWLLQIGVVLAAMLCAAVLVREGLRQPLYVAAALYVAAFLALAWKAPRIALLLVFATCPFQSDVSSGVFAKFGVAEANLALAFPVFFLYLIARKQLPTVGPILLPILLYLGVCLYSSSVTWHKDTALISLLEMVLYFFVDVMVFATFLPRLEGMRLSLYGLVAVSVFLTLAAVGTNFTFLGLNKNGLGASLSCALLVAVELWLSAPNRTTQRWMTAALAVLALGLLLSLSRGSWLGALVGLVAIFGLRRQWQALGRLLALLIPLLMIGWFLMPSESRDYATGFSRDRFNIQARFNSIDIAKSAFQKNELYGDGVGIRKEYDATNIVWMTLAETGVLGAATFLLIHAVFLGTVVKIRRRLPPASPYVTFLTVGAALILCQFTHGLVDHYWSRGAVLAAWAAAGMVMGVYQMQRRGEIPEVYS